MAVGRKTGGRKPGTPNKLTTAKRQAMADAAGEHVDDAWKTLADLMKSRKTPPQTRAYCATAILDRHYGKPLQAFEATGAGGKPLIPQDSAAAKKETARRILYMIRDAAEAA